MAQTVNFSSTTPTPPSNAINVAFQNDNSNPPNISANVPSGVAGAPNLVAVSELTGQTALISATTIFAVPSSGAGVYRITYVAAVTTAATTGAATSTLGGTNGFQVTYTDPVDSVAKTSNPTTPVISAGNTTATTIGGVVIARCKASTNLQYAFGYLSNTAAQMVYDLNIYVEYLGA